MGKPWFDLKKYTIVNNQYLQFDVQALNYDPKSMSTSLASQTLYRPHGEGFAKLTCQQVHFTPLP